MCAMGMTAAPGGGSGRTLELVLSIYAAVVFVLLWVYVATALLTDGQLLTDTWDWLGGLDTLVAVVVWILMLPVAIFVWAWQAGLEPWGMALVVIGLVIWTGIAWSGLLRVLLRRGRPST
jgi:hypothetical protein